MTPKEFRAALGDCPQFARTVETCLAERVGDR